ncbi:hypothetical protein JK361_04725 [Streptomyces sp. 5-8]|uniref:Secreted protein n=1 Tax=Streptomyces musisoli TaxID=2802280 RepID=A0ABS1NV90_9ACTN|nr:hypothetical protein [Streptomyces musisoli]MBL1103914.1 hypothetical protein [Streptomyces musisoli]
MLIAALLGLFLMHGAPAAAVGGCHGTVPDTAVMTAAHPAAHTAMTPPGDRAAASAGHSLRGALWPGHHIPPGDPPAGATNPVPRESTPRDRC